MREGYNKTIEELYGDLNSKIEGLSSKEAESRLLIYGSNIIETGKKISPFIIFISQFKDNFKK